MSIEIISTAIRNRRILQFQYVKGAKPGLRIVEPHMLAYNQKNQLVLSGWFQTGVSASGEQGWKEYLVAAMAEVVLLDKTFPGPRAGYRADGGKIFHSIQCRI
jgi:WYL domain